MKENDAIAFQWIMSSGYASKYVSVIVLRR